MKKIIALSIMVVLTASLSAQSDDYNSYKYRFQKVRGFRIYGNSNNNRINTNNTKSETIVNSSRNFVGNESDPDFNFGINGGLNYFHNINTENLQQNLSVNSDIGASISNDNVHRNSQFTGLNSVSNSVKNQNRSFGNDIYLDFNNRFYKPNNRFLMFNASINFDFGSNSFKNRSRFDELNTQSGLNNRTNNNNRFEFGFGKGRLEYVTDPIMAVFLLKDLMEKANVKNLNNEQIENIAKGITKIINTRFIDFRFRLIDQIEMLDQVLRENGVETDKSSKYYTTLNDNWLYATEFQRFSGKRWTYYLQNTTNFALSREKSTFLSAFSNTSNYFERAQRYNGTNMDNSIFIDYDKSFQKSLKVQKTKGFSASVGHFSRFDNRIFEDSIKTSQYKKTEEKYESQTIDFNVQGKWGYLYQPNTRTFLTFEVNSGIRIEKYINEKTDGQSLERDILNQNYYVNTTLRYFKFINARLNFQVDVSTFTNFNNNLITYYADKPINSLKVNDKNFGIRNDIRFSMGVNYFLY